MTNNKEIKVVAIMALVYTILFYKQGFGINLLIFEIFYLIVLLFLKRLSLSNKFQTFCGIGVLTTAISSVITHSDFSITMNIIWLLVFTGSIMYSEVKAIHSSLLLSMENIFTSPVVFTIGIATIKLKGKGIGGIMKKFAIYFIPIILIILFLTIYSASNPIFDSWLTRLIRMLEAFLSKINLNIVIIFTLLQGLFFSAILLINNTKKAIRNYDSNSTEILLRNKQKSKKSRLIAFKNDVKSGVFLLVILNLIILLLNIIDIYWVWFNFSWNGLYLKTFVHNGTFLLIISVIISIAITLYYFRGNINFYSRNKFLKLLNYIWISQNIILCITLAIRNIRYIEHFNLADKRIGIFIFLVITIIGLITVLYKIKAKKSVYFMLKVNVLSAIITLTSFSFINWDNFTARYNFSHSSTAFVHLNYLSELSDNSLPFLIKSSSELRNINKVQKKLFPKILNDNTQRPDTVNPENRWNYRYLTPEDYIKRIEFRKKWFLHKWESKGFLSWNLAEYRAYKQLKHERDVEIQ